jgi:hypothetical protein
VAGGTGALGVPTIAALVARGHPVRALARTHYNGPPTESITAPAPAHGRAADHNPRRPPDRCDETGSAASSTSTRTSHEVTGFSAPTGTCVSAMSGGGVGPARVKPGKDDPAEVDHDVVTGKRMGQVASLELGHPAIGVVPPEPP